jgi:hypothetical protein
LHCLSFSFFPLFEGGGRPIGHGSTAGIIARE